MQSEFSQSPRLAIVIPCYNEETVLPHALCQLLDYLKILIEKRLVADNSILFCVDDGSKDDTWVIISAYHQQNPNIKALKLTRNMGHQNALLAGMLTLKDKVDCVVTIDIDLQDDIFAIESMLACFRKGFDIVYGVRTTRDKDTVFKRLTALIFYRIMKQSGADIVHNHADFRLISQRAIESLSHFEERNIFLRGIFPLLGYPSTHVYYERHQRLMGKTQYTLKKMVSLAWDGITSFSQIPLNLILIFGLVSFLMSLGMITWIIIAKLMSSTVPGWASIMVPLCFIGGIQLLSIGIIGEYIAKVYVEVKRRPRFISEMELK